MALVRLARFGKPSETHLARLALERAGVAVDLRGAYRSTLTGEVPFEDAGGELWVEEADLARAQHVLQEAEQAPHDAGPDRECPACRAQNPAGFELCWQCQAPLDAAPAQTPSPGAVDGGAVAASAPPPATRWLTWSTLTIAALLAVIAVLGVMLVRARRDDQASPLWRYSYDQEGCLVESRLAGPRHAVFCDANGNGISERMELYDASGKLTQVSFDSDENGLVERYDGYSPRGAKVSMSVDARGDGRGWVVHEYARGEQRVYSDEDGDGVSDRLQLLDADGGVRLVQVLTPDGWRTRP